MKEAFGVLAAVYQKFEQKQEIARGRIALERIWWLEHTEI